jgi:hypothetical protein
MTASVRGTCKAAEAVTVTGRGLKSAPLFLPEGLTTEIRNVALRRAFVSEFAMNDLVEDILNIYLSMCPLDAERTADSRKKSAWIAASPSNSSPSLIDASQSCQMIERTHGKASSIAFRQK